MPIVLDRCKKTYDKLIEKRNELKETVKGMYERYFNDCQNEMFYLKLYQESKEMNSEYLLAHITNSPFSIIDTANNVILDSNPSITLDFNSNDIHTIIYDGLSSIFSRVSNDKELLIYFYHNYLCPLLHITSPVNLPYIVGTSIHSNRFNDGIIYNYRDSDKIVTIKYPYCIQYTSCYDILPNSIFNIIIVQQNSREELITCVNNDIYYFLRYYHVLYSKLLTIKGFSSI